jgi:DNA repair protein RadC
MYPTGNNQTIKSWADDDRPREKLLNKGKSALSDAELLAILLGSGTRSKTAVELAQEILETFDNNLCHFSKASFATLCKFHGIGEAKAVTILASLELGRRRKESEPASRVKVTSSRIIYDYLKPIFEDLEHEEFHIILLGKSNDILKTIKISQGGISGTVVDGKMVFRAALDNNARSIVLCHNHPSGQNRPSGSDLKLTKDLFAFGKMIDLQILDHLIFTDNGYFSFSDEGLLQ